MHVGQYPGLQTRILKSVQYNAKEVGGARIEGTQIGTMVLEFEENGGMLHPFYILWIHYVPTLGKRLPIPHHFTHTMREKSSLTFRTKCNMYNKFIMLKLEQSKLWCTILLDPQTNIPIFYLAPEFSKLL